MKGLNVHPIEILLVEDNPGDIRLPREALKDAKMLNRLHVVEDGDHVVKVIETFWLTIAALTPKK